MLKLEDISKNGLEKDTYTKEEVADLIYQFGVFMDKTARGLEEIKKEMNNI